MCRHRPIRRGAASVPAGHHRDQVGVAGPFPSRGSAAAGQPELAPTPADCDAAGADDDVDDGAGELGGVVGVGTGVGVGAGLVGAGLVDPEPAGFGR